MINNSTDKRRHSILVTVNFEPGIRLTRLQSELDFAHAVNSTMDQIRSDLAWLQELGLVKFNGQSAVCTARGREVAEMRAQFPTSGD
ncbi:MAG: hypothetical protein QM523_00485 [Candidatus Pacebacteria bacterium]|nr:hypothetical protein [Candidatus Paceibacterota bacterium]